MVMVLVTLSDKYPVENIKLQVDDPALNFSNEFYPGFECGSGDKPPWIVFAEARGGNLTIDINDGEYIFIYLKL